MATQTFPTDRFLPSTVATQPIDDDQFIILEPLWREALAPTTRRSIRKLSDLTEPAPYEPPTDHTYSFDRQ